MHDLCWQSKSQMFDQFWEVRKFFVANCRSVSALFHSPTWYSFQQLPAYVVNNECFNMIGLILNNQVLALRWLSANCIQWPRTLSIQRDSPPLTLQCLFAWYLKSSRALHLTSWWLYTHSNQQSIHDKWYKQVLSYRRFGHQKTYHINF